MSISAVFRNFFKGEGKVEVLKKTGGGGARREEKK